MIAEWDLTQTNLRRIRGRKYEVAMLPTSAIEAHNLHLPEGMDFLESFHVARRACELAWPRCESVVCLPGIPYGVDCNLRDFPLSLHVSQDTLNAMIRDILVSLKHFGIRKTILLNSHGGNDFTAFIRQVQADLDVHLFVCNWWTMGRDVEKDIFVDPGDHAGELETSVGLALFPELIELEHAKDGAAAPFRLEALRKGWVRTSRDFGKLNDHCGVGDPRPGTAEKGRRFLDVVCPRIADFIVELAKTPIDSKFPHAAP